MSSTKQALESFDPGKEQFNRVVPVQYKYDHSFSLNSVSVKHDYSTAIFERSKRQFRPYRLICAFCNQTALNEYGFSNFCSLQCLNGFQQCYHVLAGFIRPKAQMKISYLHDGTMWIETFDQYAKRMRKHSKNWQKLYKKPHLIEVHNRDQLPELLQEKKKEKWER